MQREPEQERRHLPDACIVTRQSTRLQYVQRSVRRMAGYGKVVESLVDDFDARFDPGETEIEVALTQADRILGCSLVLMRSSAGGLSELQSRHSPTGERAK